MELSRFLSVFQKKKDPFYELLIKQSEKTLQGITALEAFMKNPDISLAKEVERVEGEADEVRRTLIQELNQSFVTPIDREDIFALSRWVDDILDYGYTTVNEMLTLDVKPNDYITSMVITLREATGEINTAILQLRNDPKDILKHASRAKHLENEVELIYHKALSKLFNGATDISEVVYILKLREIYRHLSNAADRIDGAGNALSDIAVKIT
jgi:predicted phosphate transport protein (TIGR00153 family)